MALQSLLKLRSILFCTFSQGRVTVCPVNLGFFREIRHNQTTPSRSEAVRGLSRDLPHLALYPAIELALACWLCDLLHTHQYVASHARTTQHPHSSSAETQQLASLQESSIPRLLRIGSAGGFLQPLPDFRPVSHRLDHRVAFSFSLLQPKFAAKKHTIGYFCQAAKPVRGADIILSADSNFLDIDTPPQTLNIAHISPFDPQRRF